MNTQNTTNLDFAAEWEAQLGLAERVFVQFEAAANAQALFSQKRLKPERFQNTFMNIFSEWQDLMGVREHVLEAAYSGGFNRAVIFNLQARANNTHKAKLPLEPILLAYHTDSNKVAAFKIKSNTQHLARIWDDSSEISEALSLYKNEEHAIHVNLNDRMRAVRIYTPYDDFQEALQHIEERKKQAAARLEKPAERGAASFKMPTQKRAAVQKLAGELAYEILDAVVSPVCQRIEACIDATSLKGAQNLYADTIGCPSWIPGNIMGVYNHIVEANSVRARGTRMGALPIIARTGDLYFEDTQLWVELDAGAPLYKALGQKFKVHPNTIKQVLRHPFKALIHSNLDIHLEWLDKINVDRWPNDSSSYRGYDTMRSLAELYAEAFDKEPTQVFAQWVKEAGPRCSWQRLRLRKLKKQIKAMLAQKPMALISELNLPTRPAPNLSPARLINYPTTWLSAKDRYASRLRSLPDLKNDVERRIIKAAVIRTFEQMGQKANDTRLVDNITSACSTRMWAKTLPSEQLEANDYWHSPRVHFKNRFSSLTQTTGMEWHSIIDEPIVIDNVRIIPLTSDSALHEEGEAMDHCVWSYGTNCLKYGHHIFSLRDTQTGARLSTLDLTEHKGKAEHVSFYLNQNNGAHNNAPCTRAKAAAEAFCSDLNAGKFNINWAPIIADRKAFEAREIDESIGYDFRDPKTMQDVFALYKPCLPRKLSGQDSDIDSLARALTIAQLIQALCPTQPKAQPPCLRMGG